MLSLMLILVVVGLTLAVFFYAGTMFFQGYIYTEPSRELYWQAPAAGAALMIFFMLWCVLIASAEGATLRDIPYDTVFRFSPSVDLLPEPAPQIWAVKKDGEEKLYKRKREITGLGQTGYRYVDTTFNRPWRDDGVDGVVVEIDGEKHLFKRAEKSPGAYGEFVSDQGWVMKEYDDGPTGIPSAFRWGRFLMALLLNFGHFLLWWLCLWLLLRFQWSHALGLGFVLWLMFTLIFMPMLLSYAAEVAEQKAAMARQIAGHGSFGTITGGGGASTCSPRCA